MIATGLVPRDVLARLNENQLTLLEASIGREVLGNKELMARLGRVVKEISKNFEK